MASEKRKYVKIYRGILGTMSGQLIGINFNKNKTFNMTPLQTQTETESTQFFVAGFCEGCNIPLSYVVNALDCNDALTQILAICPNFIEVCCRQLYN